MEMGLHGRRPVRRLEYLLFKMFLSNGDDQFFKSNDVYSIGEEGKNRLV